MAQFRIEIDSDLPPGAAWDRILDLRDHDVVIPLTRLRSGIVPAREISDGHRFVAFTGVGPVGYLDPMQVTSIEHPGPENDTGRAHIVKQGRVVGGDVSVTVRARPSGSRIIWEQDWRLPWAPRFLDAVTAQPARLVYRYVLARLLARAS